MAGEVEADDFDIAKAVFDKLKDLPTERKRRILGWVAESLGVVMAPQTTAAQPSPASVTLSAQIPAVPGASKDIKSFVASKAPKNDTQFATSIAYFYRFEAPAEQRSGNITSEMLQEAARLSGRARFANPIQTLNNAKKSGYLDSSARGEFSINSVGENLVAMTLPSDAENGRSPKAKRAKPGRARKSSRG